MARTDLTTGSEFRVPSDGLDYWPDMPLLPRLPRQHGYRTVTFSSFADRHQVFWFYGEWSESHTHSLKKGDENADEVTAALLPWLRANGSSDIWFPHVQYWGPHRNYTAPQQWIDRIAGHQANYGACTASELFPQYGRQEPGPGDGRPDR